MGALHLNRLWSVRAADHPPGGSGLPGAGADRVAVGDAGVRRHAGRSLSAARGAAANCGRRAVRRLLSAVAGLAFWHWMLIATIAGPWLMMLYIKYLVFIFGVEAIFPRITGP